MNYLNRWGGPSMLNLKRDVENLLEEYSAPRWMRREVERVFDEMPSPRAIRRELDAMLDTYSSPELRWQLTHLFDAFPGISRETGVGRRGDRFVPAVDCSDRDGEYVVRADLPGMREKDIELHLDDDHHLVIKGERRDDESRNVHGYQIRERAWGAFTRSIPLPTGVDRSQIQADFRLGVLEIRVPKTANTWTRRIPVTIRDERALAGNGQATVTAS